MRKFLQHSKRILKKIKAKIKKGVNLVEKKNNV